MNDHPKEVRLHDDQIVLYQREDVESAVWHARMSFPKKYKGWVRRTTNKTNLEEAKLSAVMLYAEFTQRLEQNLPVKRVTFREIASLFIQDAHRRHTEGIRSIGRTEVIAGTLRRYLVPYFGDKDIAAINKRDVMNYRQWRKDFYITGAGSRGHSTVKKLPSSATIKQEWSVLRGVFLNALDLGYVTQNVMPMLKYEPSKVNKRPGFTAQEFEHLVGFMDQWVNQTNHTRVFKDRYLMRDYVMIMTNSGMRKGEARVLKWRDVNYYKNDIGTWVTLNVRGKTGSRLVVCQPNTEQYFARLKRRGFLIEPDDLVFCHEDGLPINDYRSYYNMLKAAGLDRDTTGKPRTVYSLRHTYATVRLENGSSVYWLKQNMGTSVEMIENHYGQTRVLEGIEYQTQDRKMAQPYDPDAKRDIIY